MNYGFRFLSLGVLVCAPMVGCVGEEPKIDNQQGNQGSCLTLQGRWALKGSSCSLDTTCTITQNGCVASFTCDDGTHSSSSVTVTGSNWNFTGASTAQPGATISCSGTKSGNTLSASCAVPGGSTCSVSGSFVGPVGGGSGGASNGGTGNTGGGVNGGTGNIGNGGSGNAAGSGATAGAGGGPPTQCTLTATSASCQDCFSTNCGDVCTACQGDAQCNTAIECIVNCTTGNCNCTTGLTDANSQTLFSNLASCLTDTCSNVCGGSTTTGAIGDACTVDADCTAANPSATCNGAWCTMGCTFDSDCGAASNDVLNHCIQNNNNVYICFPGCSVDLDCAALTGTTCQLVPGTSSTHVCASAPASAGTGGTGG